MIAKKPEELWITNVSRDKDVSIGDLRLTLRIGQSINLLKTKKNGTPSFQFTRKQIDESIASGSIFKKGDVIKVRAVAPVVFSNRIDIAERTDRDTLRNKRKAQEVEVPEFPDLDFEEGSEEEFAAQNADMDFADRAPIFAVDPKFKAPKDDDEE